MKIKWETIKASEGEFTIGMDTKWSNRVRVAIRHPADPVAGSPRCLENRFYVAEWFPFDLVSEDDGVPMLYRFMDLHDAKTYFEKYRQ
jgi:hypothetical protein